jgi:hypothetical protein
LDEFDNFLKNLSSHGNDKFLKIIDGLKSKTQDELTNFAQIFFNSRKFVSNVSVLARLAQIIEIELEIANTKTSFKNAMMKIVDETFLSLPSFEIKSKHFKTTQVDVLVALIGELYNIDWINDDQLLKQLGKFFDEDFEDDQKLETLKSLLKTVSLKMIKNHAGSKCVNVCQMLNERRDNFDDIHQQLLYEEILDILDNIVTLSTSDTIEPNDVTQVKYDKLFNDPKAVEQLLRNLNPTNFKETANKLQSIRFKNDIELSDFVKTFIKAMLESSQMEQFFSKLAVKIQASNFKEILINQLQHIFLDSFNNGSIVISKINETLRLVVFIGDLYNLDFIDSDCINLILDVLFGNEKSCNETADCINNLLITAGLKLEANNKDKMNRYYEFLKYVVELEKETTYRSKVYEDLLEMRLTEKKTKVATKSEIPSAKCSVEDFKSIWRTISSDHEQIETCAKNCKEISLKSREDSTNFIGDSLIEFLQNQFYDDQNANQIMFIAELYKLELITDKALESWIKPNSIEKLPLEIVTKIINSISSRPNVNLNVKITALLMKLEEISADEIASVCAAIKDDIAELSELFNCFKKM